MDPGDRALLNFVKGLGYVIGFLAIVIALGVLYFRYYDGMTEAISKPIEGVVIDHVTEQPIVGAVVAANWLVGYSNWHGGGEACYRGLAVETDEQGRFYFDAWRKKFPSKRTSFAVDFAVYRKGYSYVSSFYVNDARVLGKFTKWLWLINSRTQMIDSNDVRLRMKPFHGGLDERMQELHSHASITMCALGSVELGLKPDHAMFYQRILEEMRQFPEGYKDRDVEIRWLEGYIQDFTTRDFK
ncbi:MAG: hypothetical protein ACKVQA_03170 [Burkholderiales bacterium]